MTAHGRSLRETEIENNLSEALQVTLNQLEKNEDGDAISDEELSAMFLEYFLAQCNSQSDITVNILKCDAAKGLLSVEAIEHYKHPGGENGTVRAWRTAVIDREEDAA